MATVFPVNSYGKMIVNTPGILSYWRMGNQGQVRDDVAAVHGIEWNSPVVSTGALAGDGNGSTLFDGNDYLNVGDAYSFNGQSQFSIECWIRPTISTASGKFPTFISKENYNVSPNAGYGFYLEPNTNRAIFSRLGQSGAGKIYTAQAVAINGWTHLVATYDGVTLRMYRNGNYDWDTGHNTPIAVSSAFLKFGVSSPNFASDFFTGSIDEIAFYSVALSQATIQQHYNKGITPSTWLYSFSDSRALYSTESRSVLTGVTRTDSGFIRDTSTIALKSTGLSRSDTGVIGSNETGNVIITFAGARFDGGETVSLDGPQTFTSFTTLTLRDYEPAVLGSFVLGQDRLTAANNDLGTKIDVSENQDIVAFPNLVENSTISSTETMVVRDLININERFPEVVRRENGFIHYIAQRHFNGELFIDFKHSAFVLDPQVDRYGTAKYDTAVYSALGASDLQSAETFAVRRASGALLAVGDVSVNWTTGLIVVNIYTKEYENPALFAAYRTVGVEG